MVPNTKESTRIKDQNSIWVNTSTKTQMGEDPHINFELDHCSLNKTKTVDGLAQSTETNLHVTKALTPWYSITNEWET